MWDYPRPPVLRRLHSRVQVEHAGRVVADTQEALEVLETSHPSTVYLPRAAFAPDVLRLGAGQSFCEFKGAAAYLDLVSADGAVLEGVAWTYPDPTAPFTALADHVSLYPGRVDRCTVAGEQVRAQDGGFYGGWVTDAVVGPWKGPPGTWGW